MGITADSRRADGIGRRWDVSQLCLCLLTVRSAVIGLAVHRCNVGSQERAKTADQDAAVAAAARWLLKSHAR